MKHFHLSRIRHEARARLHIDFDFAIAQVGSNFTPKRPSEINAGSYWFIKSRANHVEEVFRILNFEFIKNQNTTIMSLSKKDIIAAYTQALSVYSKPFSSASIDLRIEKLLRKYHAVGANPKIRDYRFLR